MITINHILGNIYKNSDLKEKYEAIKKNNYCEHVVINRLESQKIRMRKNTDKKTDVVFMFDHTPHLRNGDVVFLDEKKMILLTLEPELVAIIPFSSIVNKYNSEDEFFSILVKIGHGIGNLHRPIKVTKNQIVFPIQAISELEMLKKMFSSFGKFIEIHTDTVIFEPDEGSDIHEH